jgi:hypothetical protein
MKKSEARMAVPDRARVLLSVQRALLGNVAPEMHTIDVFWMVGKIHLTFKVDQDGSHDIEEIANCVEAGVEGDFLPEVRVTSEVVRMSAVGGDTFVRYPDAAHATVYARLRE